MPSILALDKVSKRFGAIVIANEIDLALDDGEALGIIGPNGAGKTTLFGIMTGAVAPDAGRVTFAGHDVTGLTPARRCVMGIARSFQIPQPFGGMTVFENLVVAAAFGSGHREGHVYPRCMDILDKCGLVDKANRLAGALTLLDRKRLELARALATEPKGLLTDRDEAGITGEQVPQARQRHIGEDVAEQAQVIAAGPPRRAGERDDQQRERGEADRAAAIGEAHLDGGAHPRILGNRPSGLTASTARNAR